MAKNTYIYTPHLLERMTRSHMIPSGLPVQLAKAPSGGKGMSRKFAWVQNLEGQFLGMVMRDTLIKP